MWSLPLALVQVLNAYRVLTYLRHGVGAPGLYTVCEAGGPVVVAGNIGYIRFSLKGVQVDTGEAEAECCPACAG